jgi:hypothetical protein
LETLSGAGELGKEAFAVGAVRRHLALVVIGQQR